MTHRIIHEANGDTWDVWQVDPPEWIEPPDAPAPQDAPSSNPSSVTAGNRTPNTPLSIPAFLDPALANGWLCFESAHERRRLAPIPDGWERMTDAELRALRAWATVVPRTFGDFKPRRPKPPTDTPPRNTPPRPLQS